MSGFGAPATSGGWNMGGGDVPGAGGDMAHTGMVGANPGQQDFVDPVALYTNNWSQ